MVIIEMEGGGKIKLEMDRQAAPETNCQGLFHQIHKKSTKKVPEAPYGS